MLKGQNACRICSVAPADMKELLRVEMCMCVGGKDQRREGLPVWVTWN
jgi:hypothetical protein